MAKFCNKFTLFYWYYKKVVFSFWPSKRIGVQGFNNPSICQQICSCLGSGDCGLAWSFADSFLAFVWRTLVLCTLVPSTTITRRSCITFLHSRWASRCTVWAGILSRSDSLNFKRAWIIYIQGCEISIVSPDYADYEFSQFDRFCYWLVAFL